jgi:thioredoxin
VQLSVAQEIKHVDAKQFSELIAGGEGIILDVRTSQEYSQGHINNSTLISTNDPKFVEKVSLLQKDKPIFIYCLTGSRSYAVANYLVRNGYSNIYNLGRGILEWQRYGYPITQSKNPVASASKSYSESEFNVILSKNKTVLVDFHATWCAPCKKMAPIIEQVKNEYKGKATIEKVDVQSNKSLQKAYNVQSIPELILFQNGKEVWRKSGVISYDELSKVVDQYL